MRIGNEQLSASINCQSRGKAESCDTSQTIGTTAIVGSSGQRAHNSGRRDLTNGLIAAIGHKDISAAINSDTTRAGEQCHRAGAIGTAGNSGTASKRSHDSSWRDRTNSILLLIGHQQISARVDGQSPRKAEPGSCSYPINIAAFTHSTCNRSYDSGRGDFANCVIARIGHEQISTSIHCQTRWPAKLRGGTHTIGTPAFANRSCECGHLARRRNLANRSVTQIGHEQISTWVYCDIVWCQESSVGTPAIGVTTLIRIARQGADQPSRRNFSDGIATSVRDENIAVRIKRDSTGNHEPCTCADAVQISCSTRIPGQQSQL